MYGKFNINEKYSNIYINWKLYKENKLLHSSKNKYEKIKCFDNVCTLQIKKCEFHTTLTLKYKSFELIEKEMLNFKFGNIKHYC